MNMELQASFLDLIRKRENKEDPNYVEIQPTQDQKVSVCSIRMDRYIGTLTDIVNVLTIDGTCYLLGKAENAIAIAKQFEVVDYLVFTQVCEGCGVGYFEHNEKIGIEPNTWVLYILKNFPPYEDWKRQPVYASVDRLLRKILIENPKRAIETGNPDGRFRALVKKIYPDIVYDELAYPPHDAMDLKDIATGSVDMYLADNLLEHIENPFLAAEEAMRVVKPGGSIVFTLPFMIGLHEEPEYWRITPTGLKRILSGCQIIQVDHWGNREDCIEYLKSPGTSNPVHVPEKVRQSATKACTIIEHTQWPLMIWVVAKR